MTNHAAAWNSPGRPHVSGVRVVTAQQFHTGWRLLVRGVVIRQPYKRIKNLGNGEVLVEEPCVGCALEGRS